MQYISFKQMAQRLCSTKYTAAVGGHTIKKTFTANISGLKRLT